VTSQSIGSDTGSGGSTQVTAAFDHVAVAGASAGTGWRGTTVGGAQGEGYRVSDGKFTVTGSGDISPLVPGSGNSDSVQPVLVGAFAGLIAVIVVATMFITAEYRRGLIRVTLTASPRRGRVLAAKAVVAGVATFAVGLPAAFGAWLLGEHKLRSGGISVAPVPALTEVRMIAGTAALLAVTAVLALAIGALLRRSAAAITAVIALMVLPYFFAGPLAVLPAREADWLLRVTPAAGFAIQQAYPRYLQVAASYTPGNGYYPLAPWAGFAVLCAWTALALAAASYLLRRRDA
jgi:ABC-type transport system involved in multi-copper enzyme maturation permease subunit